MDDNAPQENPPPGFNKIDLTQLQGFSFGTQWTQDKNAREARPDRREGMPDRREDRGGPDRRDRRAFRKPAGDTPAPSGAPAPAGGEGEARPPRRDYPGAGDARGPRRDQGDFRGGPRRDGPGADGDRRFAPRGGPQFDRVPYESPYFLTTFYPEDTSFSTLAKTIRASCRTFELFDIARTVIGKPDRFVVVLQRKPADGAPGRSAGPAEPAAVAGTAKPAPFYLSVPDGVPFESDEAAVAHVLGKHLGMFFDMAEVVVEPPKGNFQVVNKCGITGELLGPPNYHRYTQIIQQHHATKLARMSFDSFRAKIETVRDPEVINQWIEKMKKVTRYTWKLSGKPAAAKAPAVPEAVAEKPEAVATGSAESTPVPAAPTGGEVTPPPAPAAGTEAAAASPLPAADPAPAAPAADPAPAASEPALAFDTLEEARTHLLTQARDRVVRTTENARFHGKLLELIPAGEIRRAVESTLERQGRFPLDTANALRGRLRREGFTIFKKGSKGISYVCAVKRKFRVPGQVFSESIGSLIAFIEAHPMVKASELPAKFLGLAPAAPAATAAGDATSPSRSAGDREGAAPTPAPVLTVEQRTQLGRMQGDLAWLVHEGYVTEFIDGRLFAAPPMVESRKKEIEATENDPENFPDVPPAAPIPAPVSSPVPEPPADSPAPAS
jgi:hypothetical protein